MSDKQLLEWLKIVTTELTDIENRFCIVAGEVVDVNDTAEVIPTLDLE